MHFKCKRGSFVSFTYLGLAVYRKIVQSSNLAHLWSDIEAIKLVLLCICVPVCTSVIVWKRICTFVKLQYILEIFII